MSDSVRVKPYILKIKNWKIRNMIMLYLDAREKFLAYRKMIRSGAFLSFERIEEICDILFEIKEDHHLLFKRLVDPKKKKFEKDHKIMPGEVETEFMNNVGLLFHKMMVAKEFKYLMERYLEDSDTFKKSSGELQYQLMKIDKLFDDGIEILKTMIAKYNDNILLLTLLLEDPTRTRKHFGQNVAEILEQFVGGQGLDEVYYSVGKFYVESGWKEKAKSMLKEALRRNPQHQPARQQLSYLM
ncbi:MAG: hypothetical protein ACE5HO_00395 [bacterium]